MVRQGEEMFCSVWYKRVKWRCDTVCFLGAIVWLVKAVVMESTMRSLQPLRTRNHGESDQLAFCIGFLLKTICLYGKEKLKIFMKIVEKHQHLKWIF